MLMIRATRDAILRPLQTVAGIVERRHTLPILANVLVRKQGEQVSFLATDIEIQISTAASLGAGAEDAAITVNARKLIDILRSLPDAEVGISLASKKLTIASGKSRFALQTLGPEEFPTVAPTGSPTASLSMPQKQLRHLFAMVHFAMAQQDIRYYLNGLLLVVDGGDVRVVATDGHRLAYCASGIDASLPRQDVIIPRKTVIELQRLLADTDEPVRIDVAANQIRFRFGEVDLLSKLVEGKFPDYQRVIPQGYRKEIVLDREVWAGALQRASILTSEKFKGVRFTLVPGSLKIQTTNAEQEEAIEELDVDYDGDALDIGFNVGYLLDVLGNLKTESVRAEFGDANSSALISVPGDDGFKYVVMPMRI
ncbi:MAG TPA: DNA polymerase III subunit beta [Burkholderiaceae bacterium]|nr:DNA polymerase III subunit beta [Burkholderiaceae bacterium]